MMAPFYAALFDAVALQAGDRVLDVGCGLGHTTLEAAERVAPHGTVVGVDFSPVMLAAARERVAGVDAVTLLRADAQAHPFEAEYDAVISGFGVVSSRSHKSHSPTCAPHCGTAVGWRSCAGGARCSRS